MTEKEAYLIVGLGSIGKRHLECLRSLRPNADITVLRQYHKDIVVPKGADRVVFDLTEALRHNPYAAIIANPAPMHVDSAMYLAKNGIHLLIEKPISDSLVGVEDLIKVCEKDRITIEVGYVLRFNECLRVFKESILSGKIGKILYFRAEVGQYLPDWRQGSDYRISVSANKELGGGALLELSHELDYLRWIFGDPIGVFASLNSSETLDIDVEDSVDCILEICGRDGNLITGSVRMDMIQRVPVRYCRAIGSEGTIEWNGIEGNTRIYDSSDPGWRTLQCSNSLDRNTSYIKQLEYFLSVANNSKVSHGSARDSLAVMKIIDAIRESSNAKKAVFL